MDQEIIEYRRQTVKGKMLISKKFSKFYLNRFRPITEHEFHDCERARTMYRSFILFGSLSLGLMSFKFRKMRVAGMEHTEAKRDPNLLGNVLNDIMMIGIGYMASHLIACDYIYKHRQYVIERLHFERAAKFQRDTFDLGSEKQYLQEYPFAEYVESSDAMLATNRILPPEIAEHAQVQKERMESYYDKQREETRPARLEEMDEERKLEAMRLKLVNIQKEFEENKK